MSAKKIFNIYAVEEFIDTYIKNMTQAFNLSDAVEAMKNDFKTSGTSVKSIEKELNAILDEHESIFYDPETDKFIPRDIFFKGAEFLITPTAYEIKHGILFPGHRFSPFCNADIFPSEIEFIPKHTKTALEVKEISHPLEDAVYYHNLLGSEQMLNYFVADNESNMEVISGKTSSHNITLTVFDMKQIYRNFAFTEGDIILVKIEEWESGEFSFDLFPGEDRNIAKKDSWLAIFEEKLLGIIDRFDDYLEIPEQLSKTLFAGNKQLLKAPGASIDEFQMMSQNVQIVFHGSHTVLARKIEESQDNNISLPEDISISQGEASSLENILKDINIPLKSIEMESYMLDELSNGEGSYDSFYERCFGCFEKKFADDAQEMAFAYFVEEKWEYISERFTPSRDEEKGALRSRIMEITDRRLEWLETVRDIDISLSPIPPANMEKLAEISHRLCSTLAFLNNENNSFSSEEVEVFLDKIENIADMQQALIGSV